MYGLQLFVYKREKKERVHKREKDEICVILVPHFGIAPV